MAGWLSSMWVLSSRPSRILETGALLVAGTAPAWSSRGWAPSPAFSFALIHDASQENELRKACLSLIKPSPSESLRVLSAKQCLAVH